MDKRDEAVKLLRRVPCYERLIDSDPGGVTMAPVFNCGTCERCVFFATFDKEKKVTG